MNVMPSLAVALAIMLGVPASAKIVGDPAGPLHIKDWVQGKPVDVLDGKNIYVVEFWATWCGPCKISIPHLSSLQAKYKDKGVVFVGVSDEPAAVVKPFLETMGTNMTYIVACDDDHKSATNYALAFQQEGIPTAYVVGKDRKVYWVGHPMGELDQTLEQLLAGKYDLAATMKKEQRARDLNEYLRLSMSGSPQASAMGDKLLSETPDDADALINFAFNISALTQNKYRDFALANRALDRAEKIRGDKDSRVLGIRGITLFESGKQQEGLKTARLAVEMAKDPQQRLNLQQFVTVMENRLKTQGQQIQNQIKTNENRAAPGTPTKR